MTDVVVIGAGASGLSVAREAVKRGCSVVVLERDDVVGGLARSLRVQGFLLDHVAHRFVPKSRFAREVLAETLGEDLLHRTRSHVIRIGDRYYGHPFSLTEFISHQPPARRLGVAADVLLHRGMQRFRGAPVTFADYVRANFGRAAYDLYFGPHYLKTTGIDPTRLLASYAERFVGSPSGEVAKAAFGLPVSPPPERPFLYPRLGSGEVWELMARAVSEAGASLRLETRVCEIERGAERCLVRAVDGEGRELEVEGRRVVSTIPLPDLVAMLRPAPEPGLLEVAASLRRLSLVCVYVFVRRERVLPRDAIYYPGSDTDFYILEDFSFLSPGIAPPGCTAVCAAMVDWDADRYWTRPDGDLLAMVRTQMAAVGFPIGDEEYLGFHVARVADARPDPTTTSREKVAALMEFANRDGVLSVGRQGTLTPLMSMDAAIELGPRTMEALGL
jgi:protoporphyrinogen oxidase